VLWLFQLLTKMGQELQMHALWLSCVLSLYSLEINPISIP
jgi:hypothetical protein